MKTLLRLFAVSTVATLTTSLIPANGQDAPPPPPDAQYAPPPPPDQQSDPNEQAQPDQAPPDQGQDDPGASFQTFYDQLGDQGTWVQTDNYGYVFQPNVSDPNWAPYSDGHWVYTDVGWTWVSNEPWGWATYHYGRWCNIDGTGWCWVPGYRWAPAWVSWRYGGGYCGWAPLPPETFIGAEYGRRGVAVGIGFHFGGDVDVNFNIGPGCYNFVPVAYMGERNYRGHYIDRSRNYTVINNTTNITNININQNGNFNRAGGRDFRGVAVGGPPVNEVNARSHERVQTVSLTSANQPGRANLQGNSLAVYAPHVNGGAEHQARPARVGQTIANPTFNRGDSISHPLAVTSNVRPNAPSAEAVQEAQQAREHAPAHARIANENTAVHPIDAPLNSMQPVTQIQRTQNVATPKTNLNPAQHSAASAPFTGEPAHQQHVTQPSAASAPFTGEPTHHTAQSSAVNAPLTGEPGGHAAASAPYTGEPTHQGAQPSAVNGTGGQTHLHDHAQAAGGSAAQAQDEFAPAQLAPSAQAAQVHPQSQQVYHPPVQQVAPQSQQTFHPQVQQSAPQQTFHPQAQQSAPQQSFHSQAQSAPQVAPHPQAQSQGGGGQGHPQGGDGGQGHPQGGGGGQGHPQGGGNSGGGHPAAAAASGDKKG